MRLKRSRKIFSILVCLSFLMSMLTFTAAPAGAVSDNHISKIVNLDEEFTGDTGVKLTIKEDSDFQNDFIDGDLFQVILPEGVNWNDTVTANVGDASAEIISDQILEVTIVGADANLIEIPLDIEIDGATGDLAVEVDALDSGVTSGKYVFARVSGDATIAKALSVETIGDPGQGGDIRIEESSLGSLGNSAQNIKLELPNHFNWDESFPADDYVSFSGGFTGTDFTVVLDGENMTINFTPPANRTTRGMITIKTYINPDQDAEYGDVEVSISGTKADDADIIIAKYADFGVDVSIDEVKEIIAGKFGEELGTFTIEENVEGAFIAGRDFTVEFPSWVKIQDCDMDLSGAFDDGDVKLGEIDGTSNELDVTIENATEGNTGKIELDFDISVEGNKTGDIEATFSGKRAGLGDDVKLVAGKAIAPVSAATDSSKDVKIGVQNQEISDIIITETKKETILDDPEGTIAGNIFLTLPEGVKFSAKPTVEVVEGNLELDEDNIALVSSSDIDDRVSIPVSDTSSKPSKIKISGIKLTVDRTVPEGDLFIKVGGGAVIENQKTNKGPNGTGSVDTIDAAEFDTGTVVKIKAGNIITPAPGDVTGTSVFKIGEAKYTLNGVEKTMDVAPYIKGDRTFMPVRYVANACGVTDSDIMWNAADSTVVLMKGDRVIKLTIGSNTMLINGVAMAIDVAPEIVDPGRTMLPLRAIAQALGCTVNWDAATQSITVTL